MLIDMHSHILPQADHGSHSLTESLTMVEKAGAAGIDVILATPHFYMQIDTVEGFLNRRDASYQMLTSALPQGSPKIIPGAEVNLQVGLQNLEGLERLCIQNTRYLLLELPAGVWTDWVYNAVYELQARRGIKPIIAHIDRYHAKSLDRLLEMEVITQVNALPFTFLRGRLRMNRYLDRIYLLGSDAHTDENRNAPEYTQFKKAVRYLKDRADTMMENAQFILGI